MNWPPDPPYDYELDGEDMSEPAEKIGSGITIEVKDYALEHVREAAAARIAEQLKSIVKEIVEQRLDALLDEGMRTMIQGKAQEAIEAYLTKPRQKTNEWGEPVPGPMEALADRIPRIVESYMGQTVNRSGQPEGNSYNSKNPTRLAWMVQTLVIEELKKETEKAAKDVTEKARAVVASHVGRFISEQMVPAIEVSK
jgi:predicted Holliday junction resolvase-like endonuclease